MTQRVLTTESGAPVADNQNSATAGVGGPILLQDQHLLEKLARFNRERIPERVVHARGSGAYGYFEVTDDVTGFTRADFLSAIGKRTMTSLRFSTVATRSARRGAHAANAAPVFHRQLWFLRLKCSLQPGTRAITTLRLPLGKQHHAVLSQGNPGMHHAFTPDFPSTRSSKRGPLHHGRQETG
ncbi:hypothetical protein GCM10018966_021320 [Streptomyces yanii]